MTTMAYPDVTHKKPVNGKFNPNSYRTISENIPENDNVPAWYAHARPPPYYTEPNPSQLPVQASEARNNPHAARKVDMVYTNTANFNAPSGIVKTDNVQKEESRWWDWSSPKAEPYGPGVRNQDEWSKKRESSYRNAFATTSDAGAAYAKRNSRYSASPNHIRAVGIVPITDLKPDDFGSVNQTHVEKVSYEQQYDSRNAANYPLRGKRQGSFINEEMKPSAYPIERSHPIPSAKPDRTACVWDLFHPNDDLRGELPSNATRYRRPLPQIKQTEKFDNVWQNAPYASDYQVDQALYQRAMMKQADTD